MQSQTSAPDLRFSTRPSNQTLKPPYQGDYEFSQDKKKNKNQNQNVLERPFKKKYLHQVRKKLSTYICFQFGQNIKTDLSFSDGISEDEAEQRDVVRSKKNLESSSRKLYQDQELKSILDFQLCEKVNFQPDGNVLLLQTQRNNKTKGTNELIKSKQQLKIENSFLREQIEQLKKQVVELKFEISQDSKYSSHAQTEQLLKLYTQQKEQIIKLNKERAEIILQFEQSQKKVLEISDNFEEQFKQKYLAQVQMTEQKLNSIQDQLNKKNLENSSLQIELNDKNTQISILKEKIKNLETENKLKQDDQMSLSFIKQKGILYFHKFKVIPDKQSIIANHSTFQNEREYYKEYVEREKKKFLKQVQEKNKIIEDQSEQIKNMSILQEKKHKEIIEIKLELKKKTESLQEMKQSYEVLQLQLQQLCSKQEIKEENSMLKQLNNEIQEKLKKALNTINDLQSNNEINNDQESERNDFDLHKEFEDKKQEKKGSAGSARLTEIPKQSSMNSKGSYQSCHENRSKILGDFYKSTMRTVGIYSTLLDYQSLNKEWKNAAQVLQHAEIDLTQNVAKYKHQEEWMDNN